MVIPLLEPIDIAGKTITADALLTQRKLASYLIERNADYVFTVKGNQPILREDIRLIFEGRATPAFTEPLPLSEDWPDAPCRYLQLSSPYDTAARTAELRGWTVQRLDAHHFWALTHPGELAASLATLIP